MKAAYLCAFMQDRLKLRFCHNVCKFALANDEKVASIFVYCNAGTVDNAQIELIQCSVCYAHNLTEREDGPATELSSSTGEEGAVPISQASSKAESGEDRRFHHRRATGKLRRCRCAASRIELQAAIARRP